VPLAHDSSEVKQAGMLRGRVWLLVLLVADTETKLDGLDGSGKERSSGDSEGRARLAALDGLVSLEADGRMRTVASMDSVAATCSKSGMSKVMLVGLKES